METLQFKTVEEYIESKPEEIRAKLLEMRKLIQENAPDAEELISYGMPAYKLNGPLVYFGAFKKHAGFYPTGSAIKKFTAELSAYKHSKGAIQFPLEEDLPVTLIKEIVRWRVKENLEKSTKKRK